MPRSWRPRKRCTMPPNDREGRAFSAGANLQVRQQADALPRRVQCSRPTTIR